MASASSNATDSGASGLEETPETAAEEDEAQPTEEQQQAEEPKEAEQQGPLTMRQQGALMLRQLAASLSEQDIQQRQLMADLAFCLIDIINHGGAVAARVQRLFSVPLKKAVLLTMCAAFGPAQPGTPLGVSIRGLSKER